jgi:hypothetical protein
MCCSLIISGKGVVDPGKAEFLCPTCRRLANVLLPDVDASLSSKKQDIHDHGKGMQETGNEWRRFWQSNKNLESAMDSFCCQVCCWHLFNIVQKSTNLTDIHL